MRLLLLHSNWVVGSAAAVAADLKIYLAASIFSALFPPLIHADVFDLATNEGLGGVVQHEQLATVLLARHFQSLHVEQRALAVSCCAAVSVNVKKRTQRDGDHRCA